MAWQETTLHDSTPTDGKILIGGYFDSIGTKRNLDNYNYLEDGVARTYIARLNSDGTLDTAFNPNIYRVNSEGGETSVKSVAIQSDGKILIQGPFTYVNDVARKYIARLNSDGSLDTAFNPDFYFYEGTFDSIAIQLDGKILIGGMFTHVNGVARNYIARLNSNGSLDTTFTPDVGAQGTNEPNIHTFVIQPDGRILIGGDFTTVCGVARNHIARLTSDYTSDADTTPSSFSFIDQTGVNLNTTITSSSIIISGINSTVSIAIIGGTYSINGGAYTNMNGTVNNGDTVRVQLTSSGNYSTTINATLTIGGVSDTFSVTTQASSDDNDDTNPYPVTDDNDNGIIDSAEDVHHDSGSGSSWCFIATAAFGSPMMEQVEILRQFRDRYLLTNSSGRKFVTWYYKNGPIAANFIKDKPFVKAAVRVTLYPLIGFSFLLIYGYLPFLIVGLLLVALFFFRLRAKKLDTI